MEALCKLFHSTFVVCSELAGGRQGRGEPAASQVRLRENGRAGYAHGALGRAAHLLPIRGLLVLRADAQELLKTTRDLGPRKPAPDQEE